MTIVEAQKIRSAFCNGYEFPFGNGDLEECCMDEVERHVELLDEALQKQIPQKPIEAEEQNIRYVTTYVCPRCKNKFTGMISKYCYHCGQALDWSDDREV